MTALVVVAGIVGLAYAIQRNDARRGRRTKQDAKQRALNAVNRRQRQ